MSAPRGPQDGYNRDFWAPLHKLIESGLTVFDVSRDGYLITLDIDEGKEGWTVNHQSDFVWFGGTFLYVLETTSKSGKGRHLYVVVDRPIADVVRAPLAIIGGSDPRREMWSAKRKSLDFPHAWCMAETKDEAVRVREFFKKHHIYFVELEGPPVNLEDTVNPVIAPETIDYIPF